MEMAVEQSVAFSAQCRAGSLPRYSMPLAGVCESLAIS